MTVGQLLDEIRDNYLTLFYETILDINEAGMEALAEAALMDEDGTILREGALSLPMRVDIVGFVDGEAKDRLSVDSPSMLTFDPIDFDWAGGLPTRLMPFHWDGCNVRVTGLHEAADWTILRGWFERWFDSNDTSQPDDHGLHGVIHFLADPKREGKVTMFEVDFGSAPVEAFEEFLDALLDSGATSIEIGYDQDG
jgi:hypothetical protein